MKKLRVIVPLFFFVTLISSENNSAYESPLIVSPDVCIPIVSYLSLQSIGRLKVTCKDLNAFVDFNGSVFTLDMLSSCLVQDFDRCTEALLSSAQNKGHEDLFYCLWERQNETELRIRRRDLYDLHWYDSTKEASLWAYRGVTTQGCIPTLEVHSVLCYHKSPLALRIFLAAGYDIAWITNSPILKFSFACYNDKCGVNNMIAHFDCLKRYGLDVTKYLFNGHETCLMLLCKHKVDRYNRMVKWLLTNEADVNAQDNDGNTALWLAICNSDMHKIKLLLKYGADANVKNKAGEYPLHAAIWSQSQEGIQALLEARAIDINITDKDKKTALMIATEWNRIWWVKLFLRYGADMYRRDSENKTAYHVACERGYLKIVALFLQAGIDINCACYGNTGLHYTVQSTNTELVKLLCAHGININAQNNFQRTALHEFCDQGYDRCQEIGEYLVKQGINLYAKDIGNNTALNLVRDSRKETLATIIENRMHQWKRCFYHKVGMILFLTSVIASMGMIT